jgi:3-hydroxyisobutyrate dehydrogenase
MARVAPIGFIGLGSMGEPMALNLVKAGTPLMVWNRSLSKCQILADAGASIAKEAADVFAQCGIVFLMLADHSAIDAVLERNSNAFHDRVRSHVIVNMSTVLPSYSKALEADIRAAGGRFVEAPVSGSRKPAEAGQLIAMLSGDTADVASVRHLFKAMCRDTFVCGEVPGALTMKLAVNLFLITMVTGLAEATHFAERLGLDLSRFVSILDAGPMASDVSRIKAAKLLQRDFARQAGITDVLKNNSLVAFTAREAGIVSPLLDVCHALYGETQALGLGDEDMVAVIQALEQRTASIP